LILTGREGIALGALAMFGPLVYQRWQAARGRRIGGSGTRSRPGSSRSGVMSRQEAYEVLGLHPGASELEIKEAHHRLMRGAHPDAGGSDWLAARINQARDILLG
jgi:DnaJ family protein C protein 19